MAQLKEYNKKRDFSKTKEPRGIKAKVGKNLRFVVQRHLSRKEHYDFRLEWQGELLSWAVPKGPSANPSDKRLAVMVENHPLSYRHFEGTIPKGEYGGGTVMLWDEGFWQPKGDFSKGLKDGVLKFALDGKRLNGGWTLIKTGKYEGNSSENWLLIKEKDELTGDLGDLTVYKSVRTGRTVKEIESGVSSKPLNDFDIESFEFQLCQLEKKPPTSNNFLYEVKYDGYRILCISKLGQVTLYTRNKLDYTKKYESLSIAIEKWANGRSLVIDGEAVVFDKDGKSDFEALQNYIRNKKGKQLIFAAFDLLYYEGENLCTLSLIERKERLEKLLKDAPTEIYYSTHIEGGGQENFKAVCHMGLEGLIAKDKNSHYIGGRTDKWLKIKCDNRQEFIICGYTVSTINKSGLSSLILGFYKDKRLIYVGRAGTGFNAQNTKELLSEFKNLITKKTPFLPAPPIKSDEKVFWLKPKLVAEIKFAGITDQNVLRQASYKGLRVDKAAEDITFEYSYKNNNSNGQIQVCGVKITNPDKILYSGQNITKLDVIKYYEQISSYMMPYIKDRVLTAVRCPGGIDKPCFFKKHSQPANSGQGTVLIDGEKYYYIKDEYGLIGEIQLGTVELHTFGCTADNLERPDIMVFDLDPDEGMDLESVRRGVRHLKVILDKLNLKSYLKTSGGKGYHILVPFSPQSWDFFKSFSKEVALTMEKLCPDKYTANMRKEKRKGKIYIDWVRNGKGATSVAPYSLRARAGAAVSAPIKWSELDKIAPNDIDIKAALERAKKFDCWKGFFD